MALLLEAHPEYWKAGSVGITTVKTSLMETANPFLAQLTPHDDHYGCGIVGLHRAHLRLAGLA